ncbi:MAG: SDR family NAD(P)-dependent oxidoreductase, partial [Hyphomicrobiales bacterium]
MGRLDGKVALITGAGRGQGRSHALTFAREGADVVALDIGDQESVGSVPYSLATSADLQETVSEVETYGRRALAAEADVRSQDAVDEAVARALDIFGKIDIVIINHGILSLGSFWELTEEQWTDMVDVNLTGVWRVTKAVTP